jgi:hypothetical protein
MQSSPTAGRGGAMTNGTQLGLDFTSPPPVRPKILVDKRTHEERFRAFHADNPQVYAELVRLARQAKSIGIQKLGIRMLWEVMRWNFLLRTTRPEGDFKLNDHYHSRYARLLNEEPGLAGSFELRELKT